MVEQAGFTGRDALRVVRAFVAYAVGATTTAAHRARAVAAMELDPGSAPVPTGLDAFPRIGALGLDLFVVDDTDFEFGLDLLISAVTRLRSQR
jgi:hypothetical protein